GLPRVQRRVPALDPVPAQLRRLRVRPGDLRPGAGAGRAGARDPDPDALLPRGVERRLRHQPALRVQDPVGAGALPARPPLGAAPSPRRMDRTGTRIAAGLIVLAFAIRVAFVLATPGSTLVHDAIDYQRHAVSIADGHGFALSY